MEWCGLVLFGSGLGPVAVSCVHGIEPSGYKKVGKIYRSSEIDGFNDSALCT
jgi:hypothetical protein